MRVPPLRIPGLILAAMAAAACGASGSGGGGGYSGGSPGTPCLPASQNMACAIAANGSAATSQVVSCDAGSGAWTLVGECPAGQFCTETAVAGAPGQLSAQCVTSAAGNSDDVSAADGGSDGHNGGPDGGPGTADGGPTDTGVPATDAGQPDAGPVDPCKSCFPGQTCVDGKCINPDPCSKCTDSQKCVDGICTNVGGACQVPSKVTKNVQKLVSLAIADGADGCDVDGDGTPDNVFGALKGIVPPESLQGAIDSGDMVLLLQAPEWSTSGNTFNVSALSGELDPASSCSPSGPGCACLVPASAYDDAGPGGVCPSKTQFVCTVVGNTLTGTSTAPVVFPLPLMGTTSSLTLEKAALQGTVSGPGGWTSTTKGLLCGAMKQSEIMDAIDAMPESTFKDLGLDKASAKAILGSMLKPDIDVDGDGEFESVSVALATSTATAQITVTAN